MTVEEKMFKQIILLASQSMGFDFLYGNELVTISEVQNNVPHGCEIGRRFVLIPKNIKYKYSSFDIDGVWKFQINMYIKPNRWEEDVIKVHNTIVKKLSEFKLNIREGILPI